MGSKVMNWLSYSATRYTILLLKYETKSTKMLRNKD